MHNIMYAQRESEYGLICLEYTDLTLDRLTYTESASFDLGFDVPKWDSETEESNETEESHESVEFCYPAPEVDTSPQLTPTSGSLTDDQPNTPPDSPRSPPPKRRKVLIDGVQLYYPCNSCENVYTSSTALEKHVEYSHSKTRSRKFTCDVCHATFSRSFCLDQHKLTHRRYDTVKHVRHRAVH